MHLVCIPSFHNNENETSFSVEYPSSLLPNTFKIDIACVWNGSTSTPAALHLKALTWSFYVRHSNRASKPQPNADPNTRIVSVWLGLLSLCWKQIFAVYATQCVHLLKCDFIFYNDSILLNVILALKSIQSWSWARWLPRSVGKINCKIYSD